MPKIKIFQYIKSLDAFVVTDEYKRMADTLGLTEWKPVVWIGRLFTLDNDYLDSIVKTKPEFRK
jgi:hypothetical protein